MSLLTDVLLSLLTGVLLSLLTGVLRKRNKADVVNAVEVRFCHGGGSEVLPWRWKCVRSNLYLRVF
jgi:hypothetical protein